MVEKIIFEMWRFLYRILCILMRWERISTQKIEKVSFNGHFGLKMGRFAPNPPVIVRLRGNAQFWGQNDHLMILFWFFELIFVLSAPKYIGYDIKIVTFRKLFFRPLLKNNKKRKNFINSVHDHFRDKRLIKMIYQKNLVKVIDWEVFALNHTWFQFLRIFWNCVRFWSFFVENGILRGY